ncbi:MAG: hypothetical protein ACO3G9_10695 [Chthoniobacterales bacterium]
MTASTPDHPVIKMTKPKPLLLPRRRVTLVFLLALAAVPAAATVDDTAKVLAGLPPADGSALKDLADAPAVKGQTDAFAETWRRFEERQLSRARAWADRELPPVRREAPVLYYTFSGPDIVYANTFFPDCRTYVMCGLEPVGSVPDLSAVPPGMLGPALRRLYGSLDTVLALGFFKTKDMGSDFRNPELPGITPVLMAFLGRLGKTVHSVDLVVLDRDGNEQPRAASEAVGEDSTPGVKIVFDSGEGTPEQTVYYFSTNISNEGLADNPGFANFCRKLEPGAGLVKAASYLMHTYPFSDTRNFLMERCKFILQDDTGIPAAVYADSQWQMRPYGRYVRPIKMFSGYYQKKLSEIHTASAEAPLDFGIGYYYRVSDCNMLLASRQPGSVATAVVVPAPAPEPEPTPEPTPEPAAIVAAAGATQAPTPEPVEAAAASPSPSPAAPAVAQVAANESASATKSPRRKLIELEAEELRIRKDPSLDKKQRMQKLREIWKLQLEVMGKKAT